MSMAYYFAFKVTYASHQPLLNRLMMILLIKLMVLFCFVLVTHLTKAIIFKMGLILNWLNFYTIIYLFLWFRQKRNIKHSLIKLFVQSNL
jgi:hypothetical protein